MQVTAPRIERRLAAILAADVVKYSRLMGADEVGTLNALKMHRRERLDPAIAFHHGRIVKTSGDGILVEFASVVDAVVCAVAIQRTMLAFNADIHTDRQIVLRIGINVGDIIIEGADIFGDGVNVAARLEALCEPGGVCISRAANDQVRDRLLLAFADLGEQRVKNIARTVGVFGLTANEIAALPEETLSQPAAEPADAVAPRRLRPTHALIVGAITLAAVLAAAGWGLRHSPVLSIAEMRSVALPEAYSPQDRRQSLIVLPFENSSGDPAQDAMAAKFTREVTETVGQDTQVPLVPASTAVAYRGTALDLPAIGRAHNVRYGLTGNTRRQDGRLIAVATLYEMENARPLWSQRFDHPDTADAWNLTLREIYIGFDQASMDADLKRAMREHPKNLDKRDLGFASQDASLQQLSKANNEAQLALVERALAVDPNYLWALREEARLLAVRVQSGFSDNRDADIDRANKLADRALTMAPNDIASLKSKMFVVRASGDINGAAVLLRKLVALSPGNGYRHGDLGAILLAQGNPREALEQFLLAKQLFVGPDSIAFTDAQLALGLLANDRFVEAIAQARLAVQEFTSENGRVGEHPWLTLIAAEAGNGQKAEARADLQIFLSTPRTWRSILEVRKNPVFAAVPNLLDGLQRAGMPPQ